MIALLLLLGCQPEEGQTPDEIRGPYRFFSQGDCVDAPDAPSVPIWTKAWAPPGVALCHRAGGDCDGWPDDLEVASSWDPAATDGPAPSGTGRPANGAYGLVVRRADVDENLGMQAPVGLIVESDRILIVGPEPQCPPVFDCGLLGCTDANPYVWAGEYSAGSQMWEIDLDWTPGHVHAVGRLSYADFSSEREPATRWAVWDIEILRGPWADGQPDDPK